MALLRKLIIKLLSNKILKTHELKLKIILDFLNLIDSLLMTVHFSNLNKIKFF